LAAWPDALLPATERELDTLLAEFDATLDRLLDDFEATLDALLADFDREEEALLASSEMAALAKAMSGTRTNDLGGIMATSLSSRL